MSSTAEAACILRAQGITKSFFGVHALRGVDLELKAGEVHALVGQNGSGKSTLCKILSGLYAKDDGELYVRGAEVEIDGPHAARENGISLIPQEPLLVPLLPAPANIFLGRESEFRRGGFIHWGQAKRRAAEALRDLDYACDLDRPVASLSPAAQEMIAIARALVWQAQVLILDEPTASLSRHEVDILFRTMNRLRDSGVSQVFISHRLEEVGRIADRVTVLVDGRVKASGPATDFPPRHIAELMVPERAAAPEGATLPGATATSPAASAQTATLAPETLTAALAVEELRVAKDTEGVSFSIRAGEVVGITGQVGSGKTEILRAVLGLDKPLAGTVRIFGQATKLRGPADAVRAGIGFLPEDRAQSLVPLLPSADNMLLSDMGRVSRLGFLRPAARRAAAAELQTKLDIATPAHLFRPVRTLSGGNQQKVGLARWLFRGSRILMFDEPTRGIDVATKARVHELIRRLAADGRAILVASSDFEEVAAVCDRALVLKRGALAAKLSGGQLTEREIVACAL